MTPDSRNQSDKEREVKVSNQQNTQISQSFEPLSFFKKDKSFVYAHRKIEKLVAAVYMITNFLPNEEPIKWSLRTLGMSLLRKNIDLKDGAGALRLEIETDIREDVLEMVSLLEVASFAGLVSEMNLSVLKKEFHNLLEHIRTIIRNSSSDRSLVKSPFFDVEADEVSDEAPLPELSAPKEILSHTSPRPAVVPQSERTSNIKDKTYLNTRPAGETSRTSLPNSRFVSAHSVPENTQETSKKLREYGPVAVKKNKRQSVIINLLKRKREIMVKDVVELIHDCSEKTIQRELLDLVARGVLRKEGERRWSRYSLA